MHNHVSVRCNCKQCTEHGKFNEDGPGPTFASPSQAAECNVVVSKINVVEDILSAECLEVVLFFPLDRKK